MIDKSRLVERTVQIDFTYKVKVPADADEHYIKNEALFNLGLNPDYVNVTVLEW